MIRAIALASLIAVLVQPALAAPPPQGAKPLSEIVAMLEAGGDVTYIDEIEWDDDDGHWDIEYYRTDGSKVDVEIDPISGESRR